MHWSELPNSWREQGTAIRYQLSYPAQNGGMSTCKLLLCVNCVNINFIVQPVSYCCVQCCCTTCTLLLCVSSVVVLQYSAMFHESGYGDTAGQVLTKAAKYVSYTCPMGVHV